MRACQSIGAIVLLGSVAVLGVGCSSTNGEVEGGDTGLPDAGDGCIQVALGVQDFQTNMFGQLTGVRYPVSPAIDGPLPERLLVELYDSTTEGLSALTPGTFALGAAPNDNLATCQHCVWIPIDWDGTAPMTKVFVATEGSMTLTQVEDPLSPVFAGTTTELVLREASIDETGRTTLVEGGRCARVPALVFDTSPSPGRSCLSAEDCGNPMLEVCSPATNTCGPLECGDFFGCPSERPVCITQYGNRYEGACYAPCDPTGPSTCVPSQTCVQFGVHASYGVCMTTGAGALGEACAAEDNSTSCLSGMVCSAAEQRCTPTCRFFSSDPGCQPDHACNVLGVCDPRSAGAAVGFGEPCGEAATLAQGCAEDSGAFRGICFAYEPTDPLLCQEACLGDLGCEPEEFCAMRFSSGLGVCLPDPVCGDGALGEIGEVCDDGNNTSNDGCSADCQTVEYDVICQAAPLLASGATSGDTASGWDGFQASCQLGLARAQVYRFVPPGRGRLRLTVESDSVHILSVRTACADAASELACGATDFSGTGELVHQVTSEGELTILVSAFTVLEQGPYTIHTEFVAESCGDGIVAGLEVCDDGNTVANDGCSADCSTVEYEVYCSQADALATSATGDNTGGPMVYTASCANTLFGSGPDRLYAYTAPSSGTVLFRLVPADTSVDMVLSVFGSCGEPSAMTELGCSSVYEIEEVEVPVTAGQTLTVLVEGFHAHSAGAYTLSATMLP